MEVNGYGERLALAVREWKRARLLADAASAEMEAKRKIYEQALGVVAGAYIVLDDLIRKDESRA